MRFGIKINKSDVLIALYVLSDILWLIGGLDFLTVPLLALQYVISFYFAYYLLSHYKLSGFLKMIYVLLAMFTFYGVLLLVSGETFATTQHGYHVINNRFYLNTIYKSFLGFFPIYVLSRSGHLTKQHLRVWGIVFFAVAIFVFFRRHDMALDNMSANAGNTDEVVNNASYIMLSLFPSIALWDNRKYLQYIGAGVCIAFCLMGMKRGAILISAVCFVFFLITTFRGEKKKKRLWLLVISIIAIVAIYKFIDFYYNSSELLQNQFERIKEGDSSSRGILFSSLWNYYNQEANIFQQLFGSGANATLQHAENFAHNDWLEILVNQGLVGVIIYAAYWIGLFKEWRRRRHIPDAYLAIGLFVIIYFMKTLFSMSYNDISYYAMFVFAFYLGSTNKQ